MDFSMRSVWSALDDAENALKAEGTDAMRWVYTQESRVERVHRALFLSDGMAREMIFTRLSGIDLSTIWNILIAILKDVAVYYGGSVVVGTAIGGVIGAFGAGAGAVPGAMAGAAVGHTLGLFVLEFMGLTSLVSGLTDIIPQAVKEYISGFREAWGAVPLHRSRGLPCGSGNTRLAAMSFARGHVLMIMGILMALVAVLTRGRADRFKALQEIRANKRLGPKVADWVEKNEDELVKDPRLQVKERTADPEPGADSQESVRQNRPPSKEQPSSPAESTKAAARSGGQVPYGSSDLSRMAQSYRSANGITGGRNVAVFEYADGDGNLQTMAAASERGVGHAERIVASQLSEAGVDPSQVTRIYSELQPCSVPGGYCASFLQKTFPQAEVTWSFEYGATAESRAAGVQALKNAVSSGGD